MWQGADFLSVVNRHHSSKLLSFWENRIFAFWRQDPRWLISAILDFRGSMMGSLKSPCTTSYRSPLATIALDCLVFEKIAFFCILATDRQTNKQMDSIEALSRSRCRERRLNNTKNGISDIIDIKRRITACPWNLV